MLIIDSGDFGCLFFMVLVAVVWRVVGWFDTPNGGFTAPHMGLYRTDNIWWVKGGFPAMN